ncbi:uncharacterized protein KRP23_14664 [Phytophthora ramorum]|uniref:uncharacterized protein n=1 Tax=Phytophthora ramorum TaxID=164328 RepID=UPI0030AF3BB7|nr:hypothetical protein KRP23_14664 [Phytophthora ramorum]
MGRFSDQQMATLIGVLSTNSHELGNRGGSGLFLSACRMEHNCLPNCSFTTFDSTLWMTAIRPYGSPNIHEQIAHKGCEKGRGSARRGRSPKSRKAHH